MRFNVYVITVTVLLVLRVLNIKVKNAIRVIPDSTWMGNFVLIMSVNAKTDWLKSAENVIRIKLKSADLALKALF
jgi:hypothetical protein